MIPGLIRLLNQATSAQVRELFLQPEINATFEVTARKTWYPNIHVLQLQMIPW